VKKPPTAATIGALVRDARASAGLSQSELGKRIGASRFWVAQFEKGKPSAELGLALKALHALGLDVRVEPREPTGRGRAATHPVRQPVPTALPAIDLGRIIAGSTVPARTRSAAGWPVVSVPKRQARGS
jgi:DNA-binding XRE family transcriptional regulator